MLADLIRKLAAQTARAKVLESALNTLLALASKPPIDATAVQDDAAPIAGAISAGLQELHYAQRDKAVALHLRADIAAKHAPPFAGERVTLRVALMLSVRDAVALVEMALLELVVPLTDTAGSPATPKTMARRSTYLATSMYL